jgi:hypothetical protein
MIAPHKAMIGLEREAQCGHRKVFLLRLDVVIMFDDPVESVKIIPPTVRK